MPAQRASTRAMKRSPRAIDFARSAAMPPAGSTAAKTSTPHSSAVIASTGGVPQTKRAMPLAGRYVGAKSNGAAWPSQPESGWRNCSRSMRAVWRGFAHTNAGAPGPPFRYL